MALQEGFARPAAYGLPDLQAIQALTPIDMHMPRIYGMRWILAFGLDKDCEKEKVYYQLKEALAHTAQQIPWIAGNVQVEAGSSIESGRIEVRDGGRGVPFTFNDLSTPEAHFPAYTALSAAHFPLSELPTAQLAPVGVIPQTENPPAFAAQANFIKGGLLLTICAHHAVCDAVGLFTIVQTWAQMSSALSTGDSPTVVGDPIINDRTRLMTGHKGASVDEFPQYVLAPTTPAASTSLNSHESSPAHHQLPPLTARIFKISASKLQSLKTATRAYSANDALIALFWRHITLARTSSPSTAPSTQQQQQHTLLLHAANIRAKLSPPLPAAYTGNASLAGVTRRVPVAELTSADGLAAAAAAIRSSVANLIASPETVARIVGLIASCDNPTDLKFAYSGFLGADVGASSWAALDVYGLCWGGGLGTAECFRVPGDGGDGAVVVLPRRVDGDVEVMVALEAGCMERLVGDEGFGAWVEGWA